MTRHTPAPVFVTRNQVTPQHTKPVCEHFHCGVHHIPAVILTHLREFPQVHWVISRNSDISRSGERSPVNPLSRLCGSHYDTNKRL
jgi:hypothetical protein